MSGSQVRKRGQARVHRVHPFSPWVQLSVPAVGQDVKGLVVPVGVVVLEDVVGAGDDAGRASGAESGRHDLGEELFPLWLLGWHWPTIFCGPSVGPVPSAGCPKFWRSSCTEGWPRRRCGAPSRRSGWSTAVYGRGGTTPRRLQSALGGHVFTEARRRGKLLLLDTDDGPTLGVRFGMTGGLVVDSVEALDRLLYGPGVFGDQWVRARVTFADGGHLLLHDPPPLRLARSWRPTRIAWDPTALYRHPGPAQAPPLARHRRRPAPGRHPSRPG